MMYRPNPSCDMPSGQQTSDFGRCGHGFVINQDKLGQLHVPEPRPGHSSGCLGWLLSLSLHLLLSGWPTNIKYTGTQNLRVKGPCGEENPLVCLAKMAFVFFLTFLHFWGQPLGMCEDPPCLQLFTFTFGHSAVSGAERLGCDTAVLQ